MADDAQPHRKFLRTRLVLEADVGVRPLLGFGISRDGGLMVDLSKHAPVARFRYGVVDVPAGAGELTATLREPESGWAYQTPPKIHYHRSGWLGVSATGRHGQWSVKAPPIEELGHVHVLTFTARHPHLWSTTSQRSSDMIFAPVGQLETISIACWIGGLDNLKEPHASNPENPRAVLAQGDSGAIVPTVIARLGAQGLGYYVWLELHPNRTFGSNDEPAVVIHAHDYAAARDLSQPFSMIGVWSVSEADAPGPATADVSRGAVERS